MWYRDWAGKKWGLDITFDLTWWGLGFSVMYCAPKYWNIDLTIGPLHLSVTRDGLGTGLSLELESDFTDAIVGK